MSSPLVTKNTKVEMTLFSPIAKQKKLRFRAVSAKDKTGITELSSAWLNLSALYENGEHGVVRDLKEAMRYAVCSGTKNGFQCD
jgi:hypothetical protein